MSKKFEGLAMSIAGSCRMQEMLEVEKGMSQDDIR